MVTDFFSDCNSKTSWNEEFVTKTLTSTSNTVTNDDIFDITGTASAAGQHTYWGYDFANLDSNLYTWIVVRYKTSEASAGLGAKVVLIFNDSSTQTILDTTFNTVWTTVSVIVTANKTIDVIRLYAVSDSNCGSGHHVYYDFALICKGKFTFPSLENLDFDMDNIYADLPIPSRIGNQTQYAGMNSPDIRLDGRIDVTTTGWGTPYGEYMMLIMQEAATDPFQWFTSDLTNCKVTPRHVKISQNREALRIWLC